MLYQLIPGFLAHDEAADFLEFAIAREGVFESTGTGVESAANEQARRSRHTFDLGPARQRIISRVSDLAPGLIVDLGLTPFEPARFEFELVAHEDGAYYRRHIDLFTRARERESVAGDRMISIVAYFHREPRAFDGGELRLFPNPKPQVVADGPVDIIPAHNTAVAFSSWLPHEVRPVRCPSGAFRDARFALNCWVLR